ncbi:hypothetical protein DES53_105245 [Roseimicrobium gellanilyticum]|uniref:Uncharacterized protein n=1 Tax=Roseimicrobium gellanilyticum TaxID=748857 RepID=A0A366HN26_9BACT|nr:hypothetical protein DES53_105245 [Roseimicrobium gellanilyticum]
MKEKLRIGNTSVACEAQMTLFGRASTTPASL